LSWSFLWTLVLPGVISGAGMVWLLRGSADVTLADG
jgi:hypothetical protein